MPLLRSLALFALLAVAAIAPVQAQKPPHWLLGTWKGELTNVATTSRYGSERTLTVTRVAADGASAKANWNGQGEAGTTVNLAVNGDQVSFTTSGAQGNSYKLVHKGDALEGSWQRSGSGKSGAVFLKKQ